MKALVLVGPTGVGKSDLALKIAADWFPDVFSIISVDSVQIYRHFDIGSGKLAPSQRRGIPHYCLDMLEPDVECNAGMFRDIALDVVTEIQSSGKLPLFAGGTGMYINAVFEGLSRVPDIDPEIRDTLMRRVIAGETQAMHQELSLVDPECASRLHPHDSQRIIRALSVYLGTGTQLSVYQGMKKGLRSEKTLFIGLDRPRADLYSSIERRVDSMVKAGLVEEVQQLIADGFGKSRAMGSLGYAQIADALSNDIPLDVAVQSVKTLTKRYAKKQLTWFRRIDGMHWFDPADEETIKGLIKEWLSAGHANIKEPVT